MRMRSLGVLALLALALSCLTACRTNVGQAAVIDGHHVSESDINSYLTPQAKPVQINGVGATAPRPFVLDVLIETRLFPKLLDATPAGAPSRAKLDSVEKQVLGGKSKKAAAAQLGIKGYSSSFYGKVVDAQVLNSVLSQELQGGVDVRSILAKLSFPVKVNPRYGKYDPKTYVVDGSRSAGLPSYLKLQ